MKYLVATQGSRKLYANERNDPTTIGWIVDEKKGTKSKTGSSVGSILARGYWELTNPKPVKKHHGPGPHPGTGTPQDIHGSGGGGPSSPSGESTTDALDDFGTEMRQRHYGKTLALIERGKELRPSLDAAMDVAEAQVEKINVGRDAINVEQKQIQDWKRLSEDARRWTHRRLVRLVERHYPTADRDQVRNAVYLSEGSFEKARSILETVEEVPDVASTIKLTKKQYEMLVYDYDYGMVEAQDMGIVFNDDYTVDIPSTAAGDRLVKDVGWYASGESGSDKRVLNAIKKKIWDAGPYQSRRSKPKPTHEYTDPTVWVKNTEGSRVMLSGDLLQDRFFRIGATEGRVWEGDKFVDAVNEEGGVFSITRQDVPGDSRFLGRSWEDWEGNEVAGLPLIHASYDIGLKYAGPGGEGEWLPMPLSTVSESMFSEYSFWHYKAKVFSGRKDANWNILNEKSRQIRDAYGDAFAGWLGDHRETGVAVDLMRTSSAGVNIAEASARFYPADWVRASNERGELSVNKRKQRGHYAESIHRGSTDLDSGEGRIVTEGSLDTNVHELGHRMEHSYTELSHAEDRFYTMRTLGSERVRLQELEPGRGYKYHEISYPDDFTDAYMGKKYSGGAYELVSMAVPRLMGARQPASKFHYKAENPYGMDEEMLHWILGVLVDV